MKYISMGMGVAPWLAYVLSAMLLIFMWVSLYFFVLSLMRAVQSQRNRG
ncbi:MAG: hypothetical protein IKJ79_05050 [Bacteroidaceae bacterium]|nr:hypothetical protein [Bacteroidaceae bacterium]